MKYWTDYCVKYPKSIAQLGMISICLHGVHTPMKTILFVEDNDVLRNNIADLLSSEGFTVREFPSGNGVLDAIDMGGVDLVLLDVGLGPDSEAGLMICREIRRRSPVLPIIFFTSHDNDYDKISGMRIGADDYVTKNESLSYLVVRIKALLRRLEIAKQNTNQPASTLKHGSLTLDMNEMRAYWREDPIDLTLTQFWLLHALAAQAGRVRNHDELMTAAKLRRVEPNTIAAHIKAIRSRFQQRDADFSCIKTERGKGYRWMNS